MSDLYIYTHTHISCLQMIPGTLQNFALSYNRIAILKIYLKIDAKRGKKNNILSYQVTRN